MLHSASQIKFSKIIDSRIPWFIAGLPDKRYIFDVTIIDTHVTFPYNQSDNHIKLKFIF